LEAQNQQLRESGVQNSRKLFEIIKNPEKRAPQVKKFAVKHLKKAKRVILRMFWAISVFLGQVWPGRVN